MEDGAGALVIELASSEGVDDERDGDLYGVAIFDCRKIDGSGAVYRAYRADLPVTGMKPIVEEAPKFFPESRCLAAATIGTDVTTEGVGHWLSPLFVGCLGKKRYMVTGRKFLVLLGLAAMSPAKFLSAKDLPLNSCKD